MGEPVPLAEAPTRGTLLLTELGWMDSRIRGKMAARRGDGWVGQKEEGGAESLNGLAEGLGRHSFFQLARR